MPNKEMNDVDKYIMMYEQMEKSMNAAKDIAAKRRIADSWQQTADSFDGNVVSEALQKMDAEEERTPKMHGGKMKNDPMKVKYNEGGSMLVPPERQQYSAGSKVIGLIVKAVQKSKSVQKGKGPKRSEVQTAIDDVKTNEADRLKEILKNNKAEQRDLDKFENYAAGGGGKGDLDAFVTSVLKPATENQSSTDAMRRVQKGARKDKVIDTSKGILIGGITVGSGYEGLNAYQSMSSKKKSEFEKAFSSAHNSGKETFEFEGKTYTTEVRKGKMSGGMMKYNEGGSMLVPLERKKYSKGKAVVKVWKALGKKATPEEKETAEKLIKNPVKSKRHSDRPFVTRSAFNFDEDANRDILLKEDYPKGSLEFQAKFLQAWQQNKRVFSHNGNQYSVDEALSEIKNKKAEGGSMLMPTEMPVDTYDNIPADEMAAAEASQLPDDEMEDNYLEFVLTESLDTDDQEYLMGVLENDERLSGIFDKVMDVAGEFSGEGEVDGPGTGVSDSIPARLSDGEFVFTKKATDQLGADQLQTMMDDAERAYDGGLMKKAFGGITYDPMQNERMQGLTENELTEEEIKKQMIGANRMPSVSR